MYRYVCKLKNIKYMKHSFITLAILLLSFTALNAQVQSTTNFDSLAVVLQQSVQKQDSIVQALKQQNNALQQQVQIMKTTNQQQQTQLSNQQVEIDSIAQLVCINAQNIQSTANELGIKIKDTNTQVDSNANHLKQSIIWGSIVAVLILIISLLLTLLLHKRGNKSIYKLQKQADELNEKIVSQLTDEISELQKISKTMQSASASSTNDYNHELVKALADRITFMEMTLYKMDSSMRGHKHLSRTIEQMKNNLLAYGYEIVSMLGKEYNEGMKVTANFVQDDTLEQGKQIISGIIKPQINYNGKMIQSAQITVSQNI